MVQKSLRKKHHDVVKKNIFFSRGKRGIAGLGPFDSYIITQDWKILLMGWKSGEKTGDHRILSTVF